MISSSPARSDQRDKKKCIDRPEVGVPKKAARRTQNHPTERRATCRKTHEEALQANNLLRSSGCAWLWKVPNVRQTRYSLMSPVGGSCTAVGCCAPVRVTSVSSESSQTAEAMRYDSRNRASDNAWRWVCHVEFPSMAWRRSGGPYHDGISQLK